MRSPITKNNPRNLEVWVFIVIVLFGLVLYLYPLRNAFFCFDDLSAIEHNEAIKQIDIPKIFNAFNTRFLVGLSFALNYKWCALNPAGYRFINFFIHCFNAFLVYLLVKSTLYLYSARKPILFSRLEWPAFFASMVFLCHPIQTEAVNSITQRFVLMGTFFYLLTLFLYIQYRCRSQKRYMIASQVAAIAAMFCKEFVVTLPLMLVLYEFYFIGSFNETVWRRCRRLIPFFVIVLIVPILLLRTPPEAIDVANIADSNSIHHADITRARYTISRKEYFLTELNVVRTYVRLLFLPINQNFDYDYPISRGMDGKTIMSGLFLLCLLVLAGVTYKSYSIISFSILWFFIALSVESSFIPIGHVIAEYRLYLASVGFALLITSLIYIREIDLRKLNMIAVGILIGFSVLTYQRNKVWKDDLTLWNDTVLKSPHKARPYNNLAKAYIDQGLLAQGMLYINKAIAMDPNNKDSYINRGIIYEKQGKTVQALVEYSKAIMIFPKSVLAYRARALVYSKLGNFTQAISDSTKAVAIDPNDPSVYVVRGVIYGKQGNFIRSISDLNKSIVIDPDNAEAYVNLGVVYGKQGNLIQAISEFNKALKINPNYIEAYNSRRLAYSLLKEQGIPISKH